MFPQIEGVTFEQNPERLKVVLPIRRNWFFFALFTLCLLVWFVFLVAMLIFIVRDVLPAQQRYTFVLTVMLLIWLLFWYYLGRVLWGRWQYYTADRELLFINKEQLILRRPVSILGSTDVYDMQYVSPLYYSDKHHCPAFDYAYQHVYFGWGMAETAARQLIRFLNNRYFPEHDDD